MLHKPFWLNLNVSRDYVDPKRLLKLIRHNMQWPQNRVNIDLREEDFVNDSGNQAITHKTNLLNIDGVQLLADVQTPGVNVHWVATEPEYGPHSGKDQFSATLVSALSSTDFMSITPFVNSSPGRIDLFFTRVL